jgi:hypothetical protein
MGYMLNDDGDFREFEVTVIYLRAGYLRGYLMSLFPRFEISCMTSNIDNTEEQRI